MTEPKIAPPPSKTCCAVPGICVWKFLLTKSFSLNILPQLEFHHICFFVGCLLEDEKQDIQRCQENQTCWQNVMVFPSSVKQDKLNGQEIFKWLFGTDCVGETLA